MMECKSALIEAKGNLPEAEIILRKRGITSASKKSSRVTTPGHHRHATFTRVRSWACWSK